MHFAKPGGSDQQFRQTCEACKKEVAIRHPESHGSYQGSRTSSADRGVAVSQAENSMMGATVGVMRAMSGYTWKDTENFQECMEKNGWYLQKSGKDDSFPVKLEGFWKNLVLEYPSSK